MTMKGKLRAFLEGLYYVYARRELINPDPLYFLYNYEDVRDLEVAGLIASSLAYGRVGQIMKSVDKVLGCLTREPHKFLLENEKFEVIPEDFRHRFTTSYDMNNFLWNISGILREYASIENFLNVCLKSSNWNLFFALDEFVDKLSLNKAEGGFSLVTRPSAGSACKRLFLFLKWLVRRDEVDPGGWTILKPSELVVPLDTHMHKISIELGLTVRRSGDLKCAIEITDKFREICPEDPVKYDFVLTRFGIRGGLNERGLSQMLN